VRLITEALSDRDDLFGSQITREHLSDLESNNKEMV